MDGKGFLSKSHGLNRNTIKADIVSELSVNCREEINSVLIASLIEVSAQVSQ